MKRLKPCPFCGQKVNAYKEKSRGGTTWLRIMHSPSIPCGIFFLDEESDAVKKWNNRSLPQDVADKILKARDAFVEKDYEAVWHYLFSMGPWKKLEQIAKRS